MMEHRKLLFSTQEYAYLAKELAQKSGFDQGCIEEKRFPDGESYHRITTDVSQRKVVLLGGTIDDKNTLELYDLAQGLVHAGASSLEIVIPYFGYSTMEREVLKGEIVKAKNRALLFSALPPCDEANKVYLLDLHSEGIPYYFDRDIRTSHIYCKQIIMASARELAQGEFVLASTDAGRAKWVESLANEMGVKSAFVYKQRLSGDQTSITGVNADVKGQVVIIYDDMIRTGGSLMQAASAYQAAGAQKIMAMTTHGLFTNHALDKIAAHGVIQHIVTTNTHPESIKLIHPLLSIKSVSSIIFEALT
jgi:ribose-phosphate pyrophosphokinase